MTTVTFRAFMIDDDPVEGRASRRLKNAESELGDVQWRLRNKGKSAYYLGKLDHAIRQAYSALNWAEFEHDDDLFVRAHEFLHDAGRYRNLTFGGVMGCPVKALDGNRYEQRCPVFLAHKRLGLSPSVILGYECSICAGDPEDCPHIEGRVYDGIPCGYRRKMSGIVEMSMVPYPKMPDNHLEAISLDNDRLQAELGPNWRPGLSFYCNKCREACPGFDYFDKLSPQEGETAL
jgi:hypothetical protein